MTEQLSKLLPPVVRVVLVPSSDHITPVINIWHDERENVRWLPLDGSFESIGADGLWQNRPSSQDILNAIQDDKENEDIILHAIVESGWLSREWILCHFLTSCLCLVFQLLASSLLSLPMMSVERLPVKIVLQ